MPRKQNADNKQFTVTANKEVIKEFKKICLDAEMEIADAFDIAINHWTKNKAAELIIKTTVIPKVKHAASPASDDVKYVLHNTKPGDMKPGVKA